MSLAILSCILGEFDTPIDPVEQNIPVVFHRFTDSNFPQIADLPPRFQYRIPKMFGWQMFKGYNYYIWLDGSMSFTRKDSAQWFLDQLGDNDIALFEHPTRKTIKEEVDHIEDQLKKKKPYITSRYKNGLHKEQYADIMTDKDFVDDKLYASTAFIYKDSEHMRDVMRLWWLHQSRYYTCDQVVLPYVVKDSAVKTIKGDVFNHKYISHVSKHE